MDHPKKKRIRARDFSAEEITVLRDLFIRHNSVLSGKHSNENTQKQKDKIYSEIVSQMNALGVSERSLQSIKDKWQAIKKAVKEKVSTGIRLKKREQTRTGGGENPTMDDPDILELLTDAEKDILSVIPAEQIVGILGGFATDESIEKSDELPRPRSPRPSSCPPILTATEDLSHGRAGGKNDLLGVL
jgi:hypothetical protein